MGEYDDVRIVNPGYGKPKFSKTEILHLSVALLVLSAAFTIIYARANPSYFSQDAVTNIAMWFLVSLALVAASFLSHEMGHKFVAQKYGAWSEFRLFPIGLVVCLVFSFLGFLFAAPGAVYINGNIDRRMNGHISLAGPVVNIAIGAVTLLVSFLTVGRISAIFMLMANLNGFLAVFNMLPIPPFDGYKVIRWSIPVYVVVMALGILLLVPKYI